MGATCPRFWNRAEVLKFSLTVENSRLRQQVSFMGTVRRNTGKKKDVDLLVTGGALRSPGRSFG